MKTDRRKLLIITYTSLLVFLLLFFFQNNSKIESNNSGLVNFNTPTLKNVIVKSFSEGEASELQPYLADYVTLDVLESMEDYDSNETIEQLNQFFEVNPPGQFMVKHEGTNRSGRGYYLIGIYVDSLKNDFRINVGTENNLINNIEINVNKDIL